MDLAAAPTTVDDVDDESHELRPVETSNDASQANCHLESPAHLSEATPTDDNDVDRGTPAPNASHAPEAHDTEDTTSGDADDAASDAPPALLKEPALKIKPTIILNAPSLAGHKLGRVGLIKADIYPIGSDTGLTRLGARYERIPPGARSSYPHAHLKEHELVYCLSGDGVLWQNGWTYPFRVGDCVSWKPATGIAHTIINDSNRDGGAGEDIEILTVGEKKDDSWWYPLSPERRIMLTEAQTWAEEDVPEQNAWGPHPGLPSKPIDSDRDSSLPRPSDAPRPSNVKHIPELVDECGEDDLFEIGTSMSQETSLGGSFGCNLELIPPGCRSSYPHAHSLEEELVVVIGGTGLLWLNGHTIPVGFGDVAGFPAGTGIAHTFINDSNADGSTAEHLCLWIIGERRTAEGDKVAYPVNPEKKATFQRWWHECPEHALGPHDGRPAKPRVDT